MSSYQDDQIKTMATIFDLIQDLTMIHKSMEHILTETVQCDYTNDFGQFKELSNATLDVTHNLRKCVQNLDPC